MIPKSVQIGTKIKNVNILLKYRNYEHFFYQIHFFTFLQFSSESDFFPLWEYVIRFFMRHTSQKFLLKLFLSLFLCLANRAFSKFTWPLSTNHSFQCIAIFFVLPKVCVMKIYLENIFSEILSIFLNSFKLKNSTIGRVLAFAKYFQTIEIISAF